MLDQYCIQLNHAVKLKELSDLTNLMFDSDLFDP